MRLTDRDKALLAGAEGDVAREATEALIQLGEAFDAPEMVDIGYAHVHAGMAMYLGDVELMEGLAARGARFTVPSTTNIGNADMGNWRETNAPEPLARLQQRAEAAHRAMGSSTCFTCTPYWAGHRPARGVHMVSIESGVTVFSNSVLGARSNRDGFFAVYAGITGRYPKFGLHCDGNRRPTHRIAVDADLHGTTDFTVLGYVIGRVVTNGVPLVAGLTASPTEDELDALGAGMATAGGIAMFVVPGITPGFETAVDHAPARLPSLGVSERDLRRVYDEFCTGAVDDFDIVHLGCPHASLAEMREYAGLVSGQRAADNVETWITTSRDVLREASAAGLLQPIGNAGIKVIVDTCPITCHFARTCSPAPELGVEPPSLRTIVVDSAKQAHYVRDMIQCPTLLTTTENAVASALSGRFVGRW